MRSAASRKLGTTSIAERSSIRLSDSPRLSTVLGSRNPAWPPALLPASTRSGYGRPSSVYAIIGIPRP